MNYDYHHRDFHLSQSIWMFALSLFQSPPYFSGLLASLMTHCAIVFQLARMYTNLSRNLTSILVCLYVVHFNLFTKGRQTLAEEKNETQPSTPAFPECPSPIDLTVDTSWLETVVFGNFRIWHIMFSGMAIFTGITVVMCCLFRCRIPRTKQEIEADFLRKKITESFLSHLEKIKIDELQGPFDQGNLLPLFKKVELFEEDRVQKNEGFEKRKLTWRQKLKRILTGKDSIDELERSFDESKDQSGAENKMTQEEMETVEKEVEGAKTDTSAINLINDQLVIFGFIGESKKDRKKRLKEQKKTEKAALKEQKAHEKLEKKLAKQQPRKSIAAGSSSARSKSAKTLLELRPESLENDQKKEWNADMKVSLENGGDSIAIDIEDRSEGSVATPESSPEERSTYEEKKHKGQEDKGYEEISLAIPEKETEVMKTKKSFASKFSFRDTVKQLINFGSKPKQKEELVINIELVKKEDELPLPIPQIECSPPEYEGEQEPILEKERHHKKRKAKMIKNDSVTTNVWEGSTKDESLDRNLLQIPEMTKCTKEMNTERKKKERKVKEEKRKRGNEKGKIVNVQDEAAIVKAAKPGKEHKKKSTAKDVKREPEKGPKEITDTATNAMEQTTEFSKRVQLKGQTEKAKQENKIEIEQKTEKKGKDKSKKKADSGQQEKLRKDAKLITVESETKYREKETTDCPLEQIVKPQKDDKSKVKKHKEEKTVAFETVKEKPPKVNSKKEKSKMKRLEFDDPSTEKIKSVEKESTEKGKIDRKLGSFPKVVEEIKLQQRMAMRESENATEHHSLLSESISSMPPPAKEHPTRVSKSTKRFSSSAHEQRSSPKTLKSEPTSVTMATDDAQEKRKNFNQMVTNLNEELKEAVDCRRKKQMKRSKTIVEDVITPQEDEELLSRSRDEFKKRLSEVLLQRRQVKPEDSQMKGEQVASVLQVRQASSQMPDGSSLAIIAAKSGQIRILTKQATSSSAEIEIPVEHVYTRGLSATVQVHPTNVEPECERDLVRHPHSTAALSFSSVPPSPTPSRASSTISVVTDNLVKKLVRSSPKTGENRELTYERSRDIIFSVDHSAQQCTSSASPQIGKNRSIEKNLPIEPSEQSSGRHKTKDKLKEKHKGRHK